MNFGPTSRVASRWAWGVAALFALVGVAQAVHGVLRYQRWMIERKIPESALRQGAAFSLPEQIGGWRRLSPDTPAIHKVETQGIFSQAWHYQNGSLMASVALDYPFRGYHDVTICYTVGGWDVLRRATHAASAENGGMPAIEVHMQRELMQRGVLWFSTIDERGRWLEGSFVNRNFLQRFSETTTDTSYRIQVLTTSYLPLSKDAEDAVLGLFQETRKLLAAQLLGQMRTK